MKKKATNDVLIDDKRQLARVAFLIVDASLFLLKSQNTIMACCFGDL